jgi:hypothetical protein
MSGICGRVALRLVWAVTLLFGLWLTWYGVLRQSFAQLGHQTGYGEGGYGGGPYGGGWVMDDATAILVGRFLGLLPTAGPLSRHDLEVNAGHAVRGVGLLAVANLLAIALAWFDLWRESRLRAEPTASPAAPDDDPLCAVHAEAALRRTAVRCGGP